ncbi:MAG: hypothetical protein Kow0047_15190 [Anaerolineae bacterium]
MEMIYKEDWEQAQERLDAWWHGAVIDRAVILVTAPREGIPFEKWTALSRPDKSTPERYLSWHTDPAQVIPRLERQVAATFWGGEAMPMAFPVSISMVAITAAYLGCPYRLIPESDSAWADPIIDDWEKRPHFSYNPESPWWIMSRELLDAAAREADGKYYVSLPDLNGPSEIVALLRGTQPLLIDLLERPQEVKAAIDEVTVAWHRYWQAANGIIHQHIGDYMFWMGIWSDRPAIDLQSDISCMISPRLFDEVILPSLEQQTQWVERTIYHLDGPGAIAHLESLLALPRLSGIQWIQGAGAPPTSRWIRLLRRIQAKGKLLVLNCEPWEVETLLTELEPEGLLLNTTCRSEAQARELLANAVRWTAHRQWVI